VHGRIRVSKVHTAIVMRSPNMCHVLPAIAGASALSTLSTIENYFLCTIETHMTEEQTPPIANKKVMSEDALAKLAVARTKALAVRRAQKLEKLKAETARLEAPAPSAPEPEPESEVEEPPEVDPSPPEPEPPKPKPKKKKPAPKAEPVVVVEQSSDDEDTYEAPPGVIFVKRRRTKKEAPAAAPSMTDEDRELDYAYRMMTSGQFRR
jgi:outer membrane biosynthesis protein TonB